MSVSVIFPYSESSYPKIALEESQRRINNWNFTSQRIIEIITRATNINFWKSLMYCLALVSLPTIISGQLVVKEGSYSLGLLDGSESLLHGISGNHDGALTLRTLSLYNGSLSETTNRVLMGSGAPGAVDFSLMDFPSVLPVDTSLWLINPDGSGFYHRLSDLILPDYLPKTIPVDTSIWLFNPDGTGQYVDASSIGESITTTNGLDTVGTGIGLGGTLIQNTVITGSASTLGLSFNAIKEFVVTSGESSRHAELNITSGLTHYGLLDTDNNTLQGIDVNAISVWVGKINNPGNIFSGTVDIGIGIRGNIFFIRTPFTSNGTILSTYGRILIGNAGLGQVDYSSYVMPSAAPPQNSFWQFNSDGNGIYVDASTIGGSITATNGLDTISTGIGLGGALTRNTTIDGNSSTFSIDNLSSLALGIKLDGPSFSMQPEGITNLGSREIIFQGESLLLNHSLGVVINSPKIQLVPAPPQTSTESAILVRNSTTGALEVRDAATLFDLLAPYLSNLPRYNKANDASNDGSLPSGSLFKVNEGDGGISSLYIKE